MSERVCVFCDYDLGKKAGEEHHFPTPKRHGGTATVPVCRSCHDLADRMPFDKWGIAEIWRCFSSIWENADPRQRIALWKMASTMQDALAQRQEA